MPNWLTQITSKRAANSRVFQTWSGARLNSFNSIGPGYFLVVDAGLMRKAAEKNNGEHTLAETVELDRALAVAQRYAGGKSAIFVCGDVGIGGLSLNGYPFRKDRGIAVLGLNSAGDPWFSWATGPNGGRYYGAAKLAASQEPHARRRLLRRQNNRRNQLHFTHRRRSILWMTSSFLELVRAQRRCTAPWIAPTCSRSSAIVSDCVRGLWAEKTRRSAGADGRAF